eukprot:CRZ01103.1 hypothetical protein [Spongospora subterranea]
MIDVVDAIFSQYPTLVDIPNNSGLTPTDTLFISPLMSDSSDHFKLYGGPLEDLPENLFRPSGPPDSIIEAIRNNRSNQLVKLLRDLKIDINCQYATDYRTLLHLAISSLSDKVAIVLLECGADPAIRDQNGNNALHSAALAEDIKVVDAIAKSHAHLIYDLNNAHQSPVDIVMTRRCFTS